VTKRHLDGMVMCVQSLALVKFFMCVAVVLA
jgi:hypothetical protein